VKKLRIGVIYGGRSGEHEVSLASGAAVFANLDRQRYDPVPLLIDKDGRWSIPDRPPQSTSAADAIGRARQEGGRSVRAAREVYVIPHPGEETAITLERGAPEERAGRDVAYIAGLRLDVLFPVLHGPCGEDGTVQGLLELADVPYVGAGVLASATGMDKAVMKVLFAARGLRIVNHVVCLADEWARDRAGCIAMVGARLGFPVFVKPANLGSSVGITKVKAANDVDAAMALAFGFDRKVIVEAAVNDPQEIECAVVGNDQPEASVAGEILPGREFYDYDAKYLDSESRAVIPAGISAAEAEQVQRLAVEAFRAIDCAGMARVDFLLERATRRVFVNEINTIPGFTTISMFPKLWEASGLAFPALLDRLIGLAFERHAAKQQLRTSYA
jgi:D-alanine-D-alanine ligase